MKKIILASASERRARILSECGIDFKVMTSDVTEISDMNCDIADIVETNASLKAESVAGKIEPEDVVIGADTLVMQGNHFIGKPVDEKAARDMLAEFSGRKIEVYSGLCVIDTSSGKKAKGSERSIICVKDMTEEEQDKIFGFLAPYDKAGGFSIEGVGAMLFDDIDGSYFNILGLPMTKLRELFKEIDLDILDFINRI